MKERSPFAILGGLLILVLAGFLLLRRGQGASASPSRPATREARSAEPRPEAPDEAASRAEARRSRDAMRSEILAALRRRDAGTPPASKAVPVSRPRPAPAAEAEPPHGHYEASYIREHFREDMFPLLKQCYESALKRSPALAGKLVLTFAIVGDPQVGGIVENADFAPESDLKDPEMEMCVRESLMTLTFDKPPTGGGYVTVTYPIAFAPGDEEEAKHGEGDAPEGGTGER